MLHPGPTLLLQTTARRVAAFIVRRLFRVRVSGIEHYHAAGPRVLIIANHTSLLDGVMLYLFLPHAPAFAINVQMARRWYVRPLRAFVHWQVMDTLSPIALKSMVRLVRAGQRAVIFPEGRITTTGTLMKVYDGPGMIADKADAMLLPVAIDGLQHSRFSYLAGLLRQRWLPQVTLQILPARKLAIPPALHGVERREYAAARVLATMHEIAFTTAYIRESLFAALVRAAGRHGPGRVVLEDSKGARLTYRQLLTRAFILGGAIARMSRGGDCVGIMLPSTAAAVVTLFACLARGRAAAMLNFTAGTRGLVTALETAGIKLVLTSRAFIEAGELHAETAALAEHAELVYLEDLRDRIGFRKN